MSSHNEEKKTYPKTIAEEAIHPRNKLSLARGCPQARKVMCDKITDKAEEYMTLMRVGNEWFGVEVHNKSDHVRHGLALRYIDMNIAWVNKKSRFRNLQWNCLMDSLFSTTAFCLYKRGVSIADATNDEVSQMEASRMNAVISTIFALMFDTRYADVTRRKSLDYVLNQPQRTGIGQGVSHATFSLGGTVNNVCWRAGKDTEYDYMLMHFFRGALFLILSFMKLYTTKQRFYVKRNLEVQTHTSTTGVVYRRVDIKHIVGLHDDERANSSDEGEDAVPKIKPSVRASNLDSDSSIDGDSDNENEGDNEISLHDYRGRSADKTFQIFVHADGSVGMFQPNSFTSIVQKVDKGVEIPELEQMIILRNTLNGIIQARQQMQRDQQRSVQSDGPSTDMIPMRAHTHSVSCPRCVVESKLKRKELQASEGFFNTTSFSSSSEGEEE